MIATSTQACTFCTRCPQHGCSTHSCSTHPCSCKVLLRRDPVAWREADTCFGLWSRPLCPQSCHSHHHTCSSPSTLSRLVHMAAHSNNVNRITSTAHCCIPLPYTLHIIPAEQLACRSSWPARCPAVAPAIRWCYLTLTPS